MTLVGRLLAILALVFMCSGAYAISAYDPKAWDPTQPRGTTRDIDFTTDEGTWMSADISPDGRWVVFDLLAQIYRVPVKGGEAQCLTQGSGIAINYHPRFSPDGKRIVFGSDRGGQENLWVMDADGKNVRPVFLDMHSRMVEPAWSADGQSIIAARRMPQPAGFYEFSTELWRFPLDGNGSERLFEQPLDENFPGAPAPSADENYIYFHAANGGGPTSDRWNLRRLALKSGRIDQVTPVKGPASDGYGSKSLAEFAPKPSPDGRWLAFARKIPNTTIEWRGLRYGPRTALWLRDLVTGQERKLLDPITMDAALTTNKHKLRQLLPDYNWSHDSRDIVLTLNGKLAKLNVASGSVKPIPFRARVQRTISEQARARQSVAQERFPVLNPRWPATSPDGRRLVFEAIGRLWIMDLPAGQPRLLTQKPLERNHSLETTPTWSPDGRWIVFVTWSDREQGHIWRLSATGGAAQRLTTESGMYLHTSWRADGVWVKRWPEALTRADIDIDTEGWEVLQLPVQGGAAKIIESGVTAIYGADSRIPDGSESSAPILPSPDNRWAAFRRFRSIYLVAGDAADDAVSRPERPGGKRISVLGGDYPRWINTNTLEWFDGHRHYRYEVSSGATQVAEIKLQLPRAFAPGVIALTGARLVTLDATQRVIENGTILVRDGRIVQIGASGTVAIDSSVHVVDASGTTIVPGWFDMHTHYTGNTLNNAFVQNYPLGALYLMSGITTTYDPGTNEPGAAFAMAENVAAGRRVGPRTLIGGQYLRGWQNDDSPDSQTDELATFADVERVFERQVARGAIQLKSYVLDNRIQKQMLIELARRRGISVTHEGQGHEFFLGVAMDGGTGMEHWLQYFPTYSDLTRFLGAARTHYSPQLWFFDYPNGAADEYWMGEWDASRDPKLQRFVPWRFLVTRKPNKRISAENFGGFMGAKTARELVEAGAYFVAGSHTLVPTVDYHYDLWTYGTAAKPMEVLVSASLHAAHMLGLEKELGSLEVGKIADLVVLNSNILQDIRRSWDIRQVMKEGRLFDAQTGDELWPQPQRYEIENAPKGLYVSACACGHIAHCRDIRSPAKPISTVMKH